MELKAIKVKYAGKCVKCGRDVREGWDAFLDASTTPKSLYCRPCAKELQDGNNTVAQERAAKLTPEEIYSLTPEMQEKMKALGLIKAPTIEEEVASLIGEVQLVADTLAGICDRLAIISGSQGEILAEMAKLSLAKETKKEAKG